MSMNLMTTTERFRAWLEQIGLSSAWVTTHTADWQLERVVCGRKGGWLRMEVRTGKVVPDLSVWNEVQKAAGASGAAPDKITMMLRFPGDSAPWLTDYWPAAQEWLQTEKSSGSGWLNKAEAIADGGTLKLLFWDTVSLEMAKKKQLELLVPEFFQTYFDARIKVVVDQQLSAEERKEKVDQFMQQQQVFERSMIDQQMKEAAAAAKVASSDDAEGPFMVGYEIKDPPVAISQIIEEEKKITVQGFVFGYESKALKNGMVLHSFSLSDYSDSIQCKVFAKTKDDQRTWERFREGMWVRLRGKVEYDRFMNPPELSMIPNDVNEVNAPPERKDDAEEKRVEFHLHTTMSTMDAVASFEMYVKQAVKWGHKAIAISDHANIQAYPDAAKMAKKHSMKVLFGVEANVLPNGIPIVHMADDRLLQESEYIVFDTETTGLSVRSNKIIEIAAVRVKNGQVGEEFQRFINPHEPIPHNITQLTNITDDMVKDAPELDVVLKEFLAFAGNGVLVAHNARFDMGFLQSNLKSIGEKPLMNPVIDTLEVARWLYPSMKNHRLNTLADKYKIKLENHHRAIDDSIALAGIMIGLFKEAVESKNVITVSDLNQDVGKDLSTVRPFHSGVYALNAKGKKRLFELVSMSHTKFFNKSANIPRSELAAQRDDLLILSGCEKGELFDAVMFKSIEEAEQIAEFYDVLEIQPICMYEHLLEKQLVNSRDQIVDAIKRIVALGQKLGKPVLATGNVHYLNPRDKILRDITIHGITGFSPLKDIKKPDAHLRTTTEMLEEFAFLGKDKAYEVVVKNSNELADRFESYKMFPDELFSPIIDGADTEIRETCYATAERMYGSPIPDVVVARLEKELKPIIQFGFSANYLISQRLVKKSNDDGYLVGSRGSVGSSVVAMMLGISEVNPLPPHHWCASCQYSEFYTDGRVPSGFDLPLRKCPSCGKQMKGEGHDIPFETFLGFKGDKVPDIDLNFSGEYQPIAHNYTKVLFGEKHVFRAGTIGTVAEKTAYGYVRKYMEDKGRSLRQAEYQRLAMGCTGVKRSTGQHPGGIVVVPDYINVNDITPVQFPADDTNADWMTTHFDYHAFDSNLLKLDILGHDDPTMMRMLQDLTGIDPQTIPMSDPKTMSIFSSVEALGVTPEQIRTSVATYGVPEMGTKFVRQMLQETQPKTFSDLLQISGLSHGTGVWLNNAQELIRNGTCTIKTVIGCRDDIMLYLIYKGNMDAALAFTITESVRKGKGLKPEWIESMKEHKIPEWYIDSCLRIEYMFPKAHASAYVISAVRTAYFKVYHPLAYYCTYYSVRADEFDLQTLSAGYETIMKKLIEIEEKGFNAQPKEKASVPIFEMALEMTSRGFKFKNIDLNRSQATRFIIDGDSLIAPFAALGGLGENAARNVVAARENGPFLSIEDFQSRSKISKTVVETLTGMGVFRGLPESNQLALF